MKIVRGLAHTRKARALQHRVRARYLAAKGEARAPLASADPLWRWPCSCGAVLMTRRELIEHLQKEHRP